MNEKQGMIMSNEDGEDVENMFDDRQDESDGNGIPEPPEPHEEARVPKAKRVQNMSSQQEVDEHVLTHIPFISWCEFCVAGKDKSNPHGKQHDKEEQQVPLVSIDYMCMEESSNDRAERQA